MEVKGREESRKTERGEDESRVAERAVERLALFSSSTGCVFFFGVN